MVKGHAGVTTQDSSLLAAGVSGGEAPEIQSLPSTTPRDVIHIWWLLLAERARKPGPRL